jgi:cytochrome c oxidase subunit 2
LAGIVTASCQTSAVGTSPASAKQAAGPEQPAAQEQVIELTLKRFEYSRKEITVKKGIPVVFEMTAQDRTHGFFLKAFGIDEDVKKGRVTRVRFVPDRVGRFEFHCDVFCGDFHEDMEGFLTVVEA